MEIEIEQSFGVCFQCRKTFSYVKEKGEFVFSPPLHYHHNAAYGFDTELQAVLSLGHYQETHI